VTAPLIDPDGAPLTAAEVAALWRVGRHQVARWVRDGHLTGYKTPGGHLRFGREEIIATTRQAGQRGEQAP
jgi:excisionase family DNA binding protein